ncbi:MAG: hypothetical protein IKS35_07555 [Clostridia bacterium]|nr:hypothetical protein [Clostridia bacterium]
MYFDTIYNIKVEVESGEITKEMKSVFFHPDILESRRYTCQVSLKNDQVVLQRLETVETLFVQQFDYGYFAGINLGSWDGWVRYFPYHTNLNDTEPVIVVQERCAGILPDPDDRKKGFLLTGDHDCNGKIYGLYLDDLTHEWQWYLIGSFEGEPYSFYYYREEMQLLIATDKAILAFSTESNEITTIAESDYLKLEPLSIVRHGDKIWCGLSAGFMSYDVSTHEETWFLVDWNQLFGT